MTTEQTLVRLEKVEDSNQFGWQWEIQFQEDMRVWTREFATDPRGEGLFERGVWGGDISPRWKQFKGTTQFSLPLDRKQAIGEICRKWIAGKSERLDD